MHGPAAWAHRGNKAQRIEGKAAPEGENNGNAQETAKDWGGRTAPGAFLAGNCRSLSRDHVNLPVTHTVHQTPTKRASQGRLIPACFC